jgi:CBS domain containing-hemolysin-like protein
VCNCLMKDVMKNSIKWSISIAVITFVLAALFSIFSNLILNEVTWVIGLVVVLIIVFIGIFFDMLGIAAAAADETPFHAMAAKKVYGSKHSIRIVRNADRFASFCNDVIGDISGIISGAAAAIVMIGLTLDLQINNGSPLEYTLNVLLTSLIAALTVAGKAMGKTLAMQYSKDIIFQVGKVLQFVEDNFRITIIKDKKDKKRKKREKLKQNI